MSSSALSQLMAASPQSSTLTQRLQRLHAKLLETVPKVDRIACALYDQGEDVLKTFINSTRAGNAITGYEYKLSDSQALSALAASGEFRVLDNIAHAMQSNTAHANWLRDQGVGCLQGYLFGAPEVSPDFSRFRKGRQEG